MNVSHETPAIRSPEALRAFAHPMRLRLYEVLLAGGPATAARLAQEVSGAPGSLSYHLRQLATHGFIEEAPELTADGRERVWRAVPGGARWTERDIESDEAAREVSNTAQHVFLARQQERLRKWLLEAKKFPTDWRDAAFSRDILLHLSAEEMRTLGNELDELIEKWVERSRAHRANEVAQRGRRSRKSALVAEPPDQPQRETVIMVVHGFPMSLRDEADSDG
jgi:DNA-binding transcriptional ArsR family regulator